MSQEPTTIATTDNAVTLRLERTFAAPREEVFRAWTTPDALAAWWWPWNPSVDVDLRPGGSYRFAGDHPQAGRIVVFGEYREVVPPERLVYTFAWEGYVPDVTVVTVEFFDRGAETQLILTQEGFSSAEVRDQHDLGWTDCFERLAVLVAKAPVTA